MSRPVVKICAVTREDEIEHLSQCGVDFFGLLVDVPSPWALSPQRARELADHSGPDIRPTLVTRPNRKVQLESLIAQTGVKAVQLGVPSTPEHVRQVRRAFSRDELVIMQEIPHGRGQFWGEEQIDDYLAAGADFILIDKLERTQPGQVQARATIALDELVAFRDRHPGRPVLVAGGVTAANVRALMSASGAVGIDVCSSVRRDGLISRELVAQLIEQLHQGKPVRSGTKPSLRVFLEAVEPGNHLIAYLTIGDPPDRFVEVANEVLAAGALTLELGFPDAKPAEGPTLSASHERALNAGVNVERAMEMLKAIARAYPDRPIVAVVQSAAITHADEFGRFLDELVEAGAAAVLPVGLAPWQLPAFAERVHQRGLETVLACPPDASRRLREIIFRYCSGCLYVPRGRVTGSSQQFGNFTDFCHLVANETDLPLVVGVGVKTAGDVAEICRTPAKAAAVGSALVDHLARGGSAAEFVRRLTAC